jgi:hypothetical protein
MCQPERILGKRRWNMDSGVYDTATVDTTSGLQRLSVEFSTRVGSRHFLEQAELVGYVP